MSVQSIAHERHRTRDLLLEYDISVAPPIPHTGGLNIIYPNVYRDTIENWNKKIKYVPYKNDILIYTDAFTIIEDGVKKNVPGIKIGDGNAYAIDLPFITEELSKQIIEHINNTSIHVTTLEKTFWTNKINIEIDNEQLIFTRN